MTSQRDVIKQLTLAAHLLQAHSRMRSRKQQQDVLTSQPNHNSSPLLIEASWRRASNNPGERHLHLVLTIRNASRWQLGAGWTAHLQVTSAATGARGVNRIASHRVWQLASQQRQEIVASLTIDEVTSALPICASLRLEFEFPACDVMDVNSSSTESVVVAVFSQQFDAVHFLTCVSDVTQLASAATVASDAYDSSVTDVAAASPQGASGFQATLARLALARRSGSARVSALLQRNADVTAALDPLTCSLTIESARVRSMLGKSFRKGQWRHSVLPRRVRKLGTGWQSVSISRKFPQALADISPGFILFISRVI